MNYHQQIYKHCSRRCRINKSITKIFPNNASHNQPSLTHDPTRTASRRFHKAANTLLNDTHPSGVHVYKPTAATSNAPSIVQSKRYFSKETSAAAATTEDAKSESSEYVFQNPKAEEIFHKMTSLTLEEISTISELINEKLGITITEADKRYGMGGGAGGGSGGGGASAQGKEEEKKEEKTNFDLKLVSFDAKAKIKVIKEIRAISGLGLKEAKEMVEGAPKVVKKDLKLDEAEELKKKLEDLGAVIELE